MGVTWARELKTSREEGGRGTREAGRGFAAGGGAEPKSKSERKRGVRGEAPVALLPEGVLNPINCPQGILLVNVIFIP